MASVAILNNMDKPDGPLAKDDRQFFQFMNLAEMQAESESHVVDFVSLILRVLNYDDSDAVIRTWPAGREFVSHGRGAGGFQNRCVLDEWL